MSNVLQFEPREHHPNTWPANRRRGDYRKAVREAADAELRVVVCGFCETASKPLDGPTGRAWFKAHQCPRSAA